MDVADVPGREGDARVDVADEDGEEHDTACGETADHLSLLGVVKTRRRLGDALMASASAMNPTVLLSTPLKRSRIICTTGKKAAVDLATRLAWKRYILVMRSWKMLFASSTALDQGQLKDGGKEWRVAGVPEEDE